MGMQTDMKLTCNAATGTAVIRPLDTTATTVLALDGATNGFQG